MSPFEAEWKEMKADKVGTSLSDIKHIRGYFRIDPSCMIEG